MAGQDNRYSSGAPWTGWVDVISAVGALLGVALLGELLAVGLGVAPPPDGFWAGVLTSAPFVFGLVYGGRWLRLNELPAERHARVVRWLAGGAIGFGLIVLTITVQTSTVSALLVVGSARWGASIGGCVGLLIGVLEALSIDRRSEAERARRREREMERERDRLEEFAGIVAHDLRNPLNVAEGHLELLREDHPSPRTDAIATALDRMDHIIEDTLTLARAGQAVGETERVDLSELVAGSWQMVETSDATLQVDDHVTVEADEDRLRLVFENLFRNAVEHGGDDVTVRVGVLDDDGVYLEDDGPGIPEPERERVFESGFTSADDGTGFGLSIVKGVVDAHGWEITITESEDGGTRFEITGMQVSSNQRDTESTVESVAP